MGRSTGTPSVPLEVLSKSGTTTDPSLRVWWRVETSLGIRSPTTLPANLPYLSFVETGAPSTQVRVRCGAPPGPMKIFDSVPDP